MTIPSNINLPGSYIDISNVRAITGLSAPEFITCFFGQSLAAGSANDEEYVQIYSEADAAAKFGAGSQLAEMFKYYFKNNVLNEVFAVALADAGGATKNVQSIVITGTATAAGTLFLYINGVQVQVAVASGDTPTVMSTSIVAAITADNTFPVTAAVVVADAILTAKNGGTIGNEIDIRFNYNDNEAYPTGVTGIVVAEDTAGATDPDITDAVAVVPDDVISLFVNPWRDVTNVGILNTEILRRFGPTVQLEGHAVSAMPGTTTVVGDFTDGLNMQHLTVMDAGLARPMPDYCQVGALAGQMAAALGDDPARPLQTLQLVGILPEIKTNRRLTNERNSLIDDGCAAITVNKAGAVLIERLVTTYLTDVSSSRDKSYQNTNTMFTSSYLRQTLISTIARAYPRHKLADDGIRYNAGQPVATPKMIKGTILGWFIILEGLALVENYDQFEDELEVVRDGTDPDRVNSVLPTDYVNQFRVFAGEIQFIL